MQTNKEKLIELFKTVPEIKENMEKLEFGTIITYCKERHLRMYFENKLVILDEYIFSVYGELQKINTDTGEYIKTLFTLDNTLDFDNQTEDIYEEIFNFVKHI